MGPNRQGGRGRDLVAGQPAAGSFAAKALAACYAISASLNTRRAYWCDTRRWLAFCEGRSVDPWRPGELSVIAWVEEMKRDGTASKTRSRRITALSSVYERLRRDQLVEVNYFSTRDGPARERSVTTTPTPLASADDVRAILATCDGSPEGIRDEAIIRMFWATGARRASVVGLTLERVRREGDAYQVVYIAKGEKEVRALVRGRAAAALGRWVEILHGGKITRGAVWRTLGGAALDEKTVWRMLGRRARAAGVQKPVTPHMFRVAFLTINPASLDAKQDAAGHVDPATTRLYDRNWRGREAFELMPEIEDA